MNFVILDSPFDYLIAEPDFIIGKSGSSISDCLYYH